MIERIKNTDSIIFLPLIIIYLFLSLLYPTIIYDILRFIAFIVLFVLLPGYTLSKWLISEEMSPIQRVILGAPISITLIGIISLIGGYCNVKYLPITICGLNIFSIYYLFISIGKKVKENKLSNYKINWLIVIFFVICVSICFFLYIAASPVPTRDKPGLYFSDALWTLGNTWSYIRFLDGLGFIDARIQGFPFSYHIFQNIYHANIHLFTGIDPFYIQFYISPIFHWFLIISILFYSGKIIGRISDSRLIIFSILLLFTSNFNWPWGRMLNHLYSNPISFFFGFPAFIILLFYSYAYLTGRNNKIDVIYLMFMFIFASSTKANLMLIYPLSLFAIYIINLFRKKIKINELYLGLSFIIAIIFLKYTIYSSTGSLSFREIKILSPKITYVDNFIMNIVHNEMVLKVYDTLYVIINYMLVFVYNSWKFLFQIPFFFILLILLRKNCDIYFIKREKLFILFCFVFTLVSFNLTLLFDFSGGYSYFYRYPQILLLFICAAFANYEYNTLKANKIILIVFLIIGIISFCNDRLFWMKQGWWKLSNVYYKVWDNRATIDIGEWNALLWLRKNASKEETIFSDRRGYIHELDKVKTNRFFGYSALSGLQAYVEGDGFFKKLKKKQVANNRWRKINKFLYSKNKYEKIQTLKTIQADYFIQSLRFNKRDYTNIRGLNKIYSNPSTIIYRIMNRFDST